MSAFDTYRQMRDSTLRNGENARDEAIQQNALMARQNAGSLIAGGDLSGGANALLGAGDISGGMAVSNAQRTRQTADRQRQQATLVAGASSLLRVPAAERPAFFASRVAPLLQEEGLGEYLSQITPENMSDQELQGFIVALGGEVETPFANDRSGPNGAVLRPDPITGEYSQAYAPQFDPRQGAPAGYVWTDESRTAQRYVPGGAADPAVIAPRAAAGRAPPRPRASGGGSRSGPAAAAPASTPARRPWERY